MGRMIAIGDIHGCAAALDAVLEAADLRGDDLLVPLGDYVDRGPDTRGVIERLIDLTENGPCPVAPILGNHDIVMLEAEHAKPGDERYRRWMDKGGRAVLESYGVDTAAGIPESHMAFLRTCRPWHETDSHVFIHANYEPDTPLDELDAHTLYWLSLRDLVPRRQHLSGKMAVVGHTPQTEVLDLGYLLCLDTGCCKGGWLTAMDVTGRQVWQADMSGRLRDATD